MLQVTYWYGSRVLSRFFISVGHETTYASSGNKHFFTKWCHLQSYQNYERPTRTSQNSDCQSFSVENWSNISKKKSLKNIGLGDQLLIKNVFGNFDF